MSFYTALTGLQAATASLGVTSNNIANVGTTGFKRSRADFGDIFATSPLQKAAATIGQGVSLKQVSQEFSQGNIQFSANSLDIAITGDGFFPLKSADGLQDIYTRNGTFLLDESFNVVNSAGQSLIAAAVDSSGKADIDNLSKLLIPPKTSGDAKETTELTLGLNFPSDGEVITKPFDRYDPTTYNKTSAVTVYDAGGNDYLATVYYVKTQTASLTDPTAKWQTFTFVGETRMKEQLIQSKEGTDALYVNKYGQVYKESQIPPELISRGVTKLIHLDDLKNPQSSVPAAVVGDQLTTGVNNAWKNGVTIVDSLQNQAPAQMGGDTQLITIAENPSTTGTLLVTLLGVLGVDGVTPVTTPFTVVVDNTDTKFTIAEKIRSLIANDPTFLNDTFPGRSVTNNGDGTVSVTYSKADGILPLEAPISTSISIVQTATSGTGAVVTAGTSRIYTAKELAFTLDVDGVDDSLRIDLTYLNDASVKRTYTGAEIAREITNVINKTYGDERFFDFTQGDINPNDDILMNMKVLNPADDTDAGLTLAFKFRQQVAPPLLADGITLGPDPDIALTGAIDLTNDNLGINSDGEFIFADLTKVTRDEVVKAMQAIIDDAAGTDKTTDAYKKFSTIKVDYDPVLQTFTFKNNNNLEIRLTAPNLAVKGLMGLTANEAVVNASTGGYEENVLPNGTLLVPLKDQRFGTVVSYDDVTRRFTISSGSTGDESSVKIVHASANAYYLLGLATKETKVSPVPFRGIESHPAVVKGGTIGLNLDNKFRVDATNNQFVVTVDNVTGLIQMPKKADYTIEEFRSTLENRINSLADRFGRTVSGVKVEILGDKNKYFVISTGTTGDNSFLKVSGNSIWGLDNLPSARGTTSTWQEPTQARNEDGFPLYVSREGKETTDPGQFSEDETRDLWTPVYYDNGELTFNNKGDLVSPFDRIAFDRATLGDSGSTLQFSIDFTASTQYSSPFSVLKQDQNGRPEGDLIGVDIQDDGLVNATYSNGTTKSLAKIVLANFAAPTGLRQLGDASYYATSKSGNARYGEAGSAGYGTVRAGARERANVDLTNELVELITAQRAFQANAKAIETNNTLTQAIINIRN